MLLESLNIPLTVLFQVDSDINDILHLCVNADNSFLLGCMHVLQGKVKAYFASLKNTSNKISIDVTGNLKLYGGFQTINSHKL